MTYNDFVSQSCEHPDCHADRNCKARSRTLGEMKSELQTCFVFSVWGRGEVHTGL
jgi:hypothetical protein